MRFTSHCATYVKMEPSHSNNLLQLADMVCGAAFPSFDTTKADRMRFRRLVNYRELNGTGLAKIKRPPPYPLAGHAHRTVTVRSAGISTFLIRNDRWK